MNNKILAVNVIVLYAWALLQANLDMQPINGLIPIAPIQDEPSFEDSGMPYLIYGYSENFTNGIRQIRQGVMSFRISARTVSELGEITNVLARAFENGDDSAANINLWSSKYNNKQLVGIRFGATDVTYIESTPPETEGGTYQGVINISYRYITSQTVKTYQPNGTWQ